MNLEVLSTSESMSLCRAAAGLVLSRFRRLANQAEEGDHKLSPLFTELAGDVERNLIEKRGLQNSDASRSVNGTRAQARQRVKSLELRDS